MPTPPFLGPCERAHIGGHHKQRVQPAGRGDMVKGQPQLEQGRKLLHTRCVYRRKPLAKGGQPHMDKGKEKLCRQQITLPASRKVKEAHCLKVL